MSLLIYSGLLYLGGVSIVLAIKPEFMFSADGNWKEFGLGRSREKYTWFPFWLFTIIWAMLSYAIVMMIMGTGTCTGSDSGTGTAIINNTMTEPIEPDQLVNSIKSKTNDVKPGYYLLHHSETVKTGIPKYVYLGTDIPNIMYNNGN